MRRSSCASASRRRSTWRAPAQALSGQVSVGLAPGTAASALSLPLLRTVRARHPGILLYLNENYGTTLSELIMNGRMDLAVLYGDKAIHGLTFLPLLKEPLFLVGAGQHAGIRPTQSRWPTCATWSCCCRVPTTSCASWSMQAFARAGMVPEGGGRDRIGLHADGRHRATGWARRILPASMAREVVAACGAWQCQIVDAGDRGAAGAVPVGPSAAFRAGAGGQGHPAGTGRATLRPGVDARRARR